MTSNLVQLIWIILTPKIIKEVHILGETIKIVQKGGRFVGVRVGVSNLQ